MNLDAIIHLYRTAGASRRRGSPVTHEQHALQCGSLAEAAGRPAALVAAALLHDLGHLLPDLEGADEEVGHELRALPLLQAMFPSAVTEPIRLHVLARRFLCVADPHHWALLPPGAQAALAREGGPFSAEEAVAFARLPHALDAIDLRRWDDQSRSPTRITPGWSHFRFVLEQARLAGGVRPVLAG